MSLAGPLVKRSLQAVVAVTLRDRPHGRSPESNHFRYSGSAPPGIEPLQSQGAEDHANLLHAAF